MCSGKSHTRHSTGMCYFNYTGTASINFNHSSFLTSERAFWSLDITFMVHVQCSLLFNNGFFPFEEK